MSLSLLSALAVGSLLTCGKETGSSSQICLTAWMPTFPPHQHHFHPPTPPHNKGEGVRGCGGVGEIPGKPTLLWNVSSSEAHCLGTWCRLLLLPVCLPAHSAHSCPRQELAGLLTSQTEATLGERVVPLAKREAAACWSSQKVRVGCSGGPRPEPGQPTATVPRASVLWPQSTAAGNTLVPSLPGRQDEPG